MSEKTEKLPIPQLVRQDHVVEFAWPEIAQAGYSLVYHVRLRMLQVLGHDAQGPLLLHQQQFNPAESHLLLPLLRAYPAYCPFNVLVAHFQYETISATATQIARSEQFLQEAREQGTAEQAIRPLRNVLSRVRVRVQPFGLHVVALLEAGYVILLRAPFTQSTASREGR